MTEPIKKQSTVNRIAGATDKEDSRQALQRAGRVIELLEEQVENSRGVFNQKLIDEDVFFTLLTRLRGSLPTVLEDAETLGQRVEQIRQEAQKFVGQLAADSQSESDHTIREANRRAEEMLAKAEEQSARVLAEASRKAQLWKVEAAQRSEDMVSRHPLKQEADRRRQETREQALREARETCEAGDLFAAEVLERAQVILSRLHEGVVKGKNQLRT